MKVTDKEVDAAYQTLISRLHATEPLSFTKSDMRKALEAAAKVRDYEPK